MLMYSFIVMIILITIQNVIRLDRVIICLIIVTMLCWLLITVGLFPSNVLSCFELVIQHVFHKSIQSDL